MCWCTSFPVYSKVAEAVEPFEQRLEDCHDVATRVGVWKEYLHAERQRDPRRLRCLYEQFVKDCCVYADAWLSYLWHQRTEARESCKLDARAAAASILPLARRAVRNCQASPQLWSELFHCLAQADSPLPALTDAFCSRCLCSCQL